MRILLFLLFAVCIVPAYAQQDKFGYLKEGYLQVFTLSKDGGTPRQLTFEENDHWGFDWSHDGRKVFFTANLHEEGELDPANSEIYEVDLATLKVRQITDRQGPDGNPAVSPDGKKVAYLGYDDRYLGYQATRLYTMNVDGTDIRLASGDLDRSIDQFEWGNDGKGIYLSYDDRGNTKIAHLTLDGKLTEIAENVGGTTLGRPYSSGSFSVSQDGLLAYTYTTTNHPADLTT
ncbi:MAG: PD40 domain-containing protein, partial [Cyclobacteriaceae bacterium]|nr:PD40 domain-containing protein [Cyclobacteriaceae bacterium]